MAASNTAVDIVGKGNWGSSLAAALPTARVITRAHWPAWQEPAGVVWLCLPDRELASAARKLARRWKKSGNAAEVVLHSSGALPAEVLAPLRGGGAAIGSAHPWMSFPTLRPVPLRGVDFALEGDAAAISVARSLIKKIGGKSFELPSDAKTLYHAFGVMASPLMVSHLAAALKIGEDAGLAPEAAQRMLAKLAGATLENWRRNGTASSFSGPLARGDAETMAAHAASVSGMPEQDVYLALARYAARNLPARRRRALLAALGEGGE